MSPLTQFGLSRYTNVNSQITPTCLRKKKTFVYNTFVHDKKIKVTRGLLNSIDI